MNEQLTDAQNIAFGMVRGVLARFKNSPNAEGLRLALGALGFVVCVRRVSWSGGVGSWRVMRGGVLRIQVRASTWAYKQIRAKRVGTSFVGGSVTLGNKYAPCIEVLPNGKGNFEGYYKSGKRAPRAGDKKPKKKRKTIRAF